MLNDLVTEIKHPLVQHKLTLMRQQDRSTNSFRRLLHEIAMLMAFAVTRDMPTHEVEVETPLDQVQLGDVIVVHTGEAVPVDGKIKEGIAMKKPVVIDVVSDMYAIAPHPWTPVARDFHSYQKG